MTHSSFTKQGLNGTVVNWTLLFMSGESLKDMSTAAPLNQGISELFKLWYYKSGNI